MLKKEFIDRMLENLPYEVKRLWMEKEEIWIDFWNKENENKEYINNLVKGLNLEDKVGEFKNLLQLALFLCKIYLY